MSDAWRTALILFVAGIVACLAALFSISRARGDEPDLRAEFFRRAKSATLANGRTGVNCCGEPDAVRVRFIGHDFKRGMIIAEIVDVMRSKYGKVGDILMVDKGLVTVGLFSPFDEPIVFINSINEPYCLAGPSGG